METYERFGFVKVAAITPDLVVADCDYNKDKIKQGIDEALAQKVRIAVFPELCITGYTCGDLFWQSTLLNSAKDALVDIADYTEGKDILVFVGLPLVVGGKLYNVAAALFDGDICGIIPKTNLPNYAEFYEARNFEPGQAMVDFVTLYNAEGYDDVYIPFGANQLFECYLPGSNVPFKVAAEICEDLWVPQPPSVSHALAGANIIVNLSASDEATGKIQYRRELVKSQSARLVCGYVYASAGEGESTTDLVFSGHNMIGENGRLVAESERFKNQMTVGYIDVDKLSAERRKMTSFAGELASGEDYEETQIFFGDGETSEDIDYSDIKRFDMNIDNAPFVPSEEADREARCEEILMIQAAGLKKRLVHTRAKSAVVGISGGLDSTLALLVTAKAFDMVGLDRKNIIAVTMPGFGTTDRTYTNAVELIKIMGATFKEISIKDAVLGHFKDIGHDVNNRDVTYENSQARQRTLILMDLANEYNGMVIGTGDLSELALGWATYNGDHMSMYGVNGSVPKTLVRHLVRFYADTCNDDVLKNILYDVLDTPVSPELLPPEEGQISQKTEDLVGPYELHDFYMYQILRFGFEPKKVYFMALKAFDGIYDKNTILKWLKVFYRRFFTQQFKRSCLPDGPKVGSVAVSPRGDLKMPSDASAQIWLKELEEIN
ncbi:MAG: NAD(+) synthase [Lachnospiraceae bacterium]|nr:NAD(+) synthase [Lachnospiraceae bacterium]